MTLRLLLYSAAKVKHDAPIAPHAKASGQDVIGAELASGAGNGFGNIDHTQPRCLARRTTPPPPCSCLKGTTTASLTLEDARRVIAAAETRANEIGQPMNIAVVDAGAILVARVREDGPWIGSVDISISKAWTSKAFDIATKHLGDKAQPTQQFSCIHTTNAHGPRCDLRGRCRLDS